MKEMDGNTWMEKNGWTGMDGKKWIETHGWRKNDEKKQVEGNGWTGMEGTKYMERHGWKHMNGQEKFICIIHRFKTMYFMCVVMQSKHKYIDLFRYKLLLHIKVIQFHFMIMLCIQCLFGC